MLAIPAKPKRLSLNLDIVKPESKELIRVKNLAGSKTVNKHKFREPVAVGTPDKTPDTGSFYADDIAEADENIDSAVDFFSLPTPDIMKTFTGNPLKVNTSSGNTPAANTPTMEGRSFAEETSLVIQHTGKPTPDLCNMFERTPQIPGPNDSLSTPVVDPDQSTRNPLAGHVYGIAPAVSLSHDAFSGMNSPVVTYAEVSDVQQQHRSSPLTTHTLVSSAPPSYYQEEDASQSSQYGVPSNSSATLSRHHGSDTTMLSHASTFTELTTRPAPAVHHPHQQHIYIHGAIVDDASVPTVVHDHFYQNSPSISAASPAASIASNDSSSFDSKELLSIPSTSYRVGSGAGKRKAGDGSSSSGTKKPRLTKKQQFVELQQREQFLIVDNENLRRRVEGMTEGCKKLKQMLMDRMKF